MGTIVGSAMFNILVIVALSAAVAGKSGASLAIDYRPVARDVCFYSYSILLLAVFFQDGIIHAWEAAWMWLSYFLYIGFMFKNETILGKCKPPGGNYKISPEDDAAATEAAAAVGGGLAANKEVTTEEKKEEGDDEGGSRFALPDSPLGYPLFLISLPLLVFMS